MNRESRVAKRLPHKGLAFLLAGSQWDAPYWEWR